MKSTGTHSVPVLFCVISNKRRGRLPVQEPSYRSAAALFFL